MQDNSEVSITFKNNITNLSELEKYSKTLKSIQGTISGINKSNQKRDNKTNLDVKTLNAGFKSLVSSSDKLVSNIKGISTGLKKAIGIAGISKLTKTLSSFVDKSSDYLENFNLFQAAFNGNYKSATKFVNKMSEMYGLDESWLIKTVGTFKQLSNAMNLTAQDGENLSKLMTQMSLDIASLYNLDIDKATSTLQSALAGQTKPIRGATGGDITVPTLQTTLDQLGISRAVNQLSFAEKRLLIIISLTKQLNKSIGDMGRTIESPANQTRILAAQWERLTRTIGSIFMKTVARILPYLNAALMVLTEIAKFVAKIFGFDLGDYDYFTGTSADIDDLSDSLDDATNSANSLKKALTGLRSFDKLNVITTPSKSSGGIGGGAGGVSGDILNAFNQAYDDYQKKLDNVKMKATEIRDIIMQWLGFTKQVDEATEEVYFTYDTVGKKAEDVAKEIATNLGNMLNYYTSKIPWEKLGETLATGINTALGFVNTFVQTYNWSKLGSNIATFLNSAIKNTDFSEIGKSLTNKIRIAILSLEGFVTTFDFATFGRKLGEAINSAVSNIPIDSLVNGLNKLAKGIFNALKELVKTINWGDLIDNIITVLEGLDWEAKALLLAPAFAKMITAIFATETVGQAIISGLGGALFTTGGAAAGGAAVTGAAGSIISGGGAAATGAKVAGGAAAGGAAAKTFGLTTLGKFVVLAVAADSIAKTGAKLRTEGEDLGDFIEKTTRNATQGQKEYLKNEEDIDKLVMNTNLHRESNLKLLRQGTGTLAQILGYHKSTLETTKQNVLTQGKEIDRQIELLNEVGGTKEQQQAVGANILKQQSYLKQVIAETKLAGGNTKELEAEHARISEIIRKMPTDMYPFIDNLKLGTSLSKDMSGDSSLIDKMWGNISKKFDSVIPNMDNISEKTKSTKEQAEQVKENWDKVNTFVKDKLGINLEALKIKTKSANEETNKNNAIWDKINERVQKYTKINVDKTSNITITTDTTKAENGLSGFISKLKGNLQTAFNSIDFSGMKSKFASVFKNIPGLKDTALGKALGLASGGLPPVGQLFVANERGPELVGQIGGQSFVANQNQMMDLLDKKIASAGNNNSNQVFNIYLDENHKLGTYTLEQLQGMAKTNGKPISIGY